MTEQARGGRAMWGAHFEADPAPLMAQINASIGFDKRLHAQDLKGSMAHARMLKAVGLLSEAECRAILDGLERSGARSRRGGSPLRPSSRTSISTSNRGSPS
jgi:argininosuccinate lyase